MRSLDAMAILKVARLGHPVLRAKAQPVPVPEIGTPRVQQLIDDMFETMREYQGIGLAAPQVHVSLRIFVAGLGGSPSVSEARDASSAAGMPDASRAVVKPGTSRAVAMPGASRAVAMDDDHEMPLVVIVNPELSLVPGASEEAWEGCLSVPDMRGRVPRAIGVSVRGYDRHGQRIEVTAKGLPARVIQHEYDHLDGVLFFDRMPTLATLTFMDEYQRFWAKADHDEEDDE
jgi:peptide deformylase